MAPDSPPGRGAIPEVAFQDGAGVRGISRGDRQYHPHRRAVWCRSGAGRASSSAFPDAGCEREAGGELLPSDPKHHEAGGELLPYGPKHRSVGAAGMVAGTGSACGGEAGGATAGVALLGGRGLAIWSAGRATALFAFLAHIGAPATRDGDHTRARAVRVLPGGLGHRAGGAGAGHPLLRPRLGGRLDRQLRARHHPGGSHRRAAALRALPQPRAAGHAGHRYRLRLPPSGRDARLRGGTLWRGAHRHGGHDQHLQCALRHPRGRQGDRDVGAAHRPHQQVHAAHRRKPDSRRRRTSARAARLRLRGRCTEGAARHLRGDRRVPAPPQRPPRRSGDLTRPDHQLHAARGLRQGCDRLSIRQGRCGDARSGEDGHARAAQPRRHRGGASHHPRDARRVARPR